MTRGSRFLNTVGVTARLLAACLCLHALPAVAGDLSGLLTPDLMASYAAGYTPTFQRIAPVPPARPAITTAALEAYVGQGYVPTPQRVTLAGHERLCLAQAIYFEARGEPEAGQWAVAQVVLNRVAHPQYPDDICDVVYQGASTPGHCQFSFACDGRSDMGGQGNRIVRESWVKANLIAAEAYRFYLEGRALDELPASALYYHARRVSPEWASAYQQVASIGGHVFYAGL